MKIFAKFRLIILSLFFFSIILSSCGEILEILLTPTEQQDANNQDTTPDGTKKKKGKG